MWLCYFTVLNRLLEVDGHLNRPQFARMVFSLLVTENGVLARGLVTTGGTLKLRIDGPVAGFVVSG